MILLVGIYIGAGAMICWWLLLDQPLTFVAMFAITTVSALLWRLGMACLEWRRERAERRADPREWGN